MPGDPILEPFLARAWREEVLSAFRRV